MPEPVPPIIPTVSPFFIESEISESASSLAFGYANPTFSNVIISPSYPAKSSSPLPPVIEDLISKISFILFAHALAFDKRIIRFANFTSSTKICDI